MDKETLMKMPVPKLREEALKIEGLAGVHGMKKAELLEVLFDQYGIEQEIKPKKDTAALKRSIVELRAEKEKARTAGDKKRVDILRKKIHAVKRQTRD